MKLFLFAIFLSLSANAFIIDTSDIGKKTSKGCAPTASMVVDNPPKRQNSYNDLLQKEGNFTNKLEEPIILFGRIRDENCAPIANAQIEIWQSDQYGVNRFIHDKAVNNQMYSNFQGVGVADSNNKGEFAFVTVYPKKGNINVRAKYQHFPELKTKLELLENNQVVPNGKRVQAINLDYARIDGYKVYYFDLVLAGKEKNIAQ